MRRAAPWILGCVIGLGGASRCALGAGSSPGSEFLPRLIALTPDKPMAYFELAEEISYEMQGGVGRALATHLLVVALELDRRSARPVPLGRSVCLALADITPDSGERAWLLAMARSLTPAGGSAGADQPANAAHQSESGPALPVRTGATELALALGRFRAGDPRPIRALLDGGSVVRTLTDGGVPPGAAGELTDLLASRIPELRRLRTPDSDGRVERYTVEGVQMLRLDPATHGHPGPVLSDAQTVLVLGAEARLLGAAPDSWAADASIAMGQPVRDINPASLAAYYKVDVGMVYFTPDPSHPDDISRGTWSGAGAGAVESEDGAEKGVGDEREEEQGQVDDGGDEQLAG